MQEVFNFVDPTYPGNSGYDDVMQTWTASYHFLASKPMKMPETDHFFHHHVDQRMTSS